MSEFRIECYMSDNNAKDVKLSHLNEQDLTKWKKEVEAYALSNYYNKKIKLLSKKIDF